MIRLRCNLFPAIVRCDPSHAFFVCLLKSTMPKTFRDYRVATRRNRHQLWKPATCLPIATVRSHLPLTHMCLKRIQYP